MESTKSLTPDSPTIPAARIHTMRTATAPEGASPINAEPVHVTPGSQVEVLTLAPSKRRMHLRIARRLDRAAKRTLDIVVAATLLLLLLPLTVLLIGLIRLDSPGPAFFRCERVGYRGRRLRMAKFRKMFDGASGHALTTDDDNRFTRMGRWLANTKLDELPQLWHVVRGEMSLVGPRPEDRSFVDHHQAAYERILTVRPGMTGLSQLAFAEEGKVLDDEDPIGHYLDRLLPQKVRMDQLYATEATTWTDLKILFWTAAAVILRRNVAVHRDSGKMNLRRR